MEMFIIGLILETPFLYLKEVCAKGNTAESKLVSQQFASYYIIMAFYEEEDETSCFAAFSTIERTIHGKGYVVF